MKKMLWAAGLTLALTAAFASTAYAQEAQDPPGPGTGGGMQEGDGEGPLHDLMVQAAARLLGLDPAEVESRLAEGQTIVQIALDEGLGLHEFRLEWRQARREVIEKALEDGVIQREQLGRMAIRRAYLRGRSDCPGMPFDRLPEASPAP